MKAKSWRVAVVLGLLAGALPVAHAAQKSSASDYPNKPIRFIVPFPPGGSNDVLSRYLGIKLSERLGQQVVIDNRAGANGIIGTEIASQAPNDGYTMLIVSTSYVLNAAVRERLPYDIEKSFDPVSFIGEAPNCIVVHPKGTFGTLKDLVERARAKPASIFYAATGIGGFNHFGGELFKKVAKIDMVMVPYKGGGPAMTDVIAGQIPVMFSSVTQVLPHVRNNRLKVLGVGATKRTSALPDVPTVAEAGFPGYEMAVWWGIVVPHGVPAAVQNRLRNEINAILKDPETVKRLRNDAAEPRIVMPAEMRKLIRNDLKKWSDVAKTAGIRVQ